MKNKESNSAKKQKSNSAVWEELEVLTESEIMACVGGVSASAKAYSSSTIDYDIALVITTGDIPIA